MSRRGFGCFVRSWARLLKALGLRFVKIGAYRDQRRTYNRHRRLSNRRSIGSAVRTDSKGISSCWLQ